MTTPIKALEQAGVAVWLDDLGRHRIQSGELARLVEQVGIVGVTTNPSIFATAVRDGAEYQDELSASTDDAATTLHRLMVHDVQAACSVLAPAYERTNALDGRVSFEVDPRHAFDTEATIAAAQKIWRDLDRPNVMVKIPATEAGLPAITASLAAGISINVTLIFGIDRYRAVQDAWLSGLEQAKANGHDLSTIGSVASFFVSRMDTVVDRQLDQLLNDGAISSERHAALRGRAAVANARNAYRVFEQAREGRRWKDLEAAGALPQRPLWASTSTKDPSFAPTRYVDELVAPDTVNTMPTHTLDAVLASEITTRSSTIDDATTGADAALFSELGVLGIHYDDVVNELEQAGVKAFIDSWKTLLQMVGDAQQRAAG
ncbi:MAG TPA: transaldolase [Actinomycetes bacterium]|nr:transaldolase [Actinomycetes bacterium]